MKCRCLSIIHDKEQGCIIDHDGHFGDFCDACNLRCHPEKQVQKRPDLKHKECTHPSDHMVKGQRKKQITAKDEFTDEEIVVGFTMIQTAWCKRCKKRWTSE